MPAGGCVLVGKHPDDGRCYCQQYDTRQKRRSGNLKRLCEEQGLKFKVGKVGSSVASSVARINISTNPTVSSNIMEGLDMGKADKYIDSFAGFRDPLSLPPLDGIDGFGMLQEALGNFKDTEALKSAGATAVAGGLGILGYAQLLEKVEALQNLNPWVKTAVGLAIAYGGGVALKDRFNPNSLRNSAASGLTAGIGGYVLADLFSQLVFKKPLFAVHTAETPADSAAASTTAPAAATEGLDDDEDYLDSSGVSFGSARIDEPDITGSFEAFGLIEDKTAGGDFAGFDDSDVDVKDASFASFMG